MAKFPLLAILACFLVICLQITSGAYFYLSDNETACFLEDVPEDTAVLAKYANLEYDLLAQGSKNKPQIIQIVVSDPTGRVIVSHEAQKKGRVAFTSKMAGDHKICLEVINSIRKARQYKFGLKVQSANEVIDYSALAKQEHLSAIVVELTKMSDRVNARRQAQNYQKRLEAKTRDETESVNERVLYWFAFQTIIIVAAMVYQVFKLRRFFKLKQLTQ